MIVRAVYAATDKKKWVSDARFLEVLSIASAIPGPSSTQVITSMGLLRAGPLGGLLALIFWMLPGFTVMTLAGIGAKSYLHGTVQVSCAGLSFGRRFTELALIFLVCVCDYQTDFRNGCLALRLLPCLWS